MKVRRPAVGRDVRRCDVRLRLRRAAPRHPHRRGACGRDRAAFARLEAKTTISPSRLKIGLESTRGSKVNRAAHAARGLERPDVRRPRARVLHGDRRASPRGDRADLEPRNVRRRRACRPPCPLGPARRACARTRPGPAGTPARPPTPRRPPARPRWRPSSRPPRPASPRRSSSSRPGSKAWAMRVRSRRKSNRPPPARRRPPSAGSACRCRRRSTRPSRRCPRARRPRGCGRGTGSGARPAGSGGGGASRPLGRNRAS